MADSETLVAAQTSGGEEDANRNEDQPMPDAQNPSDGSDSESDSDSDDEAQVKEQIEALETALYNNPSDYDSHVQDTGGGNALWRCYDDHPIVLYIKILRKQGDLEKLRQAREAMSSLFPLTPDMWQEWTKDETTVSSGLEAFHAVERLYERGVSDYLKRGEMSQLAPIFTLFGACITCHRNVIQVILLAEDLSVALWCAYLNFVQEYDPSIRECSAAGISKARNLFERALTAAGLHVTEGCRIWELYREFEQAIFLTFVETDSGAKEKQTQRIRNLFHRQLSVPLADLKSTLLAYKAWEADHESSIDVNSEEFEGLPSHVVSAYQKALEMLNARSHLEEQISKKDVDSEKLEEFMTYLKFEHSFGDPARIQILYERAIAEFPVSSELWLEYTKYLDKTFKTARIVRDAYYRATRNCPWVGELWVRYLLSLERSHGSEEELSTVFEKSLLCTFSSFDEYLNIFLTRVDGLRRRISASTQVEDGLSYAAIRDIFQRASDYLSPHLNNTDKLLNMHSYWARLELKLGKDLVAARGVWESLLKTSGSMLEAWQGYIVWEIEMDHINEARSLYKRCYSKRFPGTGSEDICQSWVRFEREYGSLEDFDIAVHKVTPRLQELQLFRLQQESKDTGPAANERESSRKTTREKRKPPSSSTHEQSPAKRSKNMAQDLKKTKENDKGQPRHSAEASEAAALDVNKAESAGLQESKDKSSKRSVPFNDQCTAFVSNLSLQATDDDLRNFFADVGGVVAVRILKDKFTKKSRGLAYVDFSDDAHLAAAVEKNKQILLGKRLSILKSDPQGRKKAAGRGTRSEYANAGETDSQETSKRQNESQAQSSRSRHDEDVQLKGRNTFAVPRNVKPLGWSSRSKPQPEGDEEQEDETPKSNDEFRKMFLKT
ncbi:Squamous cell carcinoma antigen recognized by T-cells 3 [Sesamum angolense]|uniref:Squamous cell carcinoma antigen recognized by T-cells 3 n=1 Tax=Sesamum angolense TaxID=2727404 RepID=A0AAE1WYM3_9LAMI|nr:Squamous cell carcinoma antigen recognized by T-cells 3 [Sesamum angolense]